MRCNGFLNDGGTVASQAAAAAAAAISLLLAADAAIHWLHVVITALPLIHVGPPPPQLMLPWGLL